MRVDEASALGPLALGITSLLDIPVQTSEFVFKLQFSKSFDQSRQFDASCTETANNQTNISGSAS